MMIVGLCDTSGNKTSYSCITTLKFIVLSGQVYSKMIFRPVVEAQLFSMLGEYSYYFALDCHMKSIQGMDWWKGYSVGIK
jgi:hypothetical protein